MVPSLPFETLQKITEYLSPITLERFSRVCKAARHAALPRLFKKIRLKGISKDQLQRCLFEISPSALKATKELHIVITLHKDFMRSSAAPDVCNAALWPFSHFLNSASSLEVVAIHINQSYIESTIIATTGLLPCWSSLAHSISTSASSRNKPFITTLECDGFVLDNYGDIQALEGIINHFDFVEAVHLPLHSSYEDEDEDDADVLNYREPDHLLSTPKFCMENVETSFQFKLAAKIGVARMKLVPYDIPQEDLNGAVTFKNLEELELEFELDDDVYFYSRLLQNLKAPRLLKLSVVVESQDFQALVKIVYLYCSDHPNLKYLSLKLRHVCSISKTDHESLMRLRSLMSTPGREFDLKIEHCVVTSSALLRDLQDDSLLSDLEVLSISVDQDAETPGQRASRVLLPALKKLEFTLHTYTDARSVSVVHSWLDGIGHPALDELAIYFEAPLQVDYVLPLQPIIAHLPLLPVGCSVGLKESLESAVWPSVNLWTTREGSSLKEQCDKLGITLVIRGVMIR